MISYLLPLFFRSVCVNQDKLKLINPSCCFVAVLGKIKDFSPALDASSFLHLLRHVVGYALEGAGFLLCHLAVLSLNWESSIVLIGFTIMYGVRQ